MKKLIFLSFVLFSTTCFSQKAEKRDGIYSAFLYSVDTPKDIKAGAVDSLLSAYEDSNIKIIWEYAGSEINFELTNKTDQTIKIMWDDAAFISISNETGRIFHKGIKYTDRENSQPPTTVYKKTTLSDLICPTAYTTYVPGQYGGWNSRPLIPYKSTIWSTKIEYEPHLLGLTMRVVLPIKIEDKLLEYVFNFKTEFIQRKKKK